MTRADKLEEKRWQAEMDARTLMQAEEIKLDASRKNAAIAQLTKLVIDKEKEAKAAKSVASSLKKSKPVTKKKPSNRRKK